MPQNTASNLAFVLLTACWPIYQKEQKKKHADQLV